MFGDRIKEAVKEIGTVKELSEASGIGVRTLRTYLTNSSQPSAENLAKIALATKVDSHWLLTGERLNTAEEISSTRTDTKEIDIGLFMQVYEATPKYVPCTIGEFPITNTIRAYNKVVLEPENIRALKAQLLLVQDALVFHSRILKAEMAYKPIDKTEASFYRSQATRLSSKIDELKETEKEILRSIQSIQSS